MSETTKPLELPADVRRSAERLLSRRFGGRVRVEKSDTLRPLPGRTLVLRLHLRAGETQETAILKQVQPAEGERFDPRQAGASAPAWRFFNDWTGAQLLNETRQGTPLAPEVIGADPRLGLLLLEDLGDGESLADVLLGNDPDRATEALQALARALGQVGARTSGRLEEYESLRRAAGGPRQGLEELRSRVTEQVTRVHDTFEEVGFEWTPALVDDIEQVSASMMQPGPFLTYSHGDPCPDNNLLLPDGIRLFDYEMGGFRHALLDGAYPRFPFPTCWCVNRLPPHLVERLEGLYRYELTKGVPEAADDGSFHRGIVEACAFWLIWSSNANLREALRFDRRWGISTLRQRFVLRTGIFAETSRELGHLPALGAFAARLHDRLRAEWPSLPEMPLYPAFQRVG